MDKRIVELHSYQVLLDAKRAYSLLESVESDEQLFRIYWITCITLLRTIAEVVTRIDCNDCSYGAYWEKRKAYLQKLSKEYENKPFDECPEDYLYWTRLFRDERNSVVHEYELGFSELYSTFLFCGQDVFDEDIFVIDPSIYRTMGNMHYWGDMDCRDWIQSALRWWEKELANIVKNGDE